MIRFLMRAAVISGVLLLCACASAPLHYYTLVPSARGQPTATGGTAGLPFELLRVSVPAQVDQPQLVVREGGQSVFLLNGERWIAPLADEVRSALSADLIQQLGSRDVTGLAGNDTPTVRIKLDLRRFDSQPGSYALIDGAWSVHLLHAQKSSADATSAEKTFDMDPVSCSSRIRETVGPGYNALVQGHQRAIAQLAGQIATVVRQLGSGQPAHCPTS